MLELLKISNNNGKILMMDDTHNKVALIWDLDGTLLDSYGVILDSLEQVCNEYNLPFNKEVVAKDVITYSVNHYLLEVSEECGVPFDVIRNRCSEVSRYNNMNITPMTHAIELLDKLKEKGIRNYVFTHRGVSTEGVLKNIKMYDYFEELVTSLSGFLRKPDPGGINYLIDKYHLDRKNTYYVGDRSIDMESASNAHIKSVLYKPDGSVTVPIGSENYIIKDLLEILDLF